VADTLSPAQTPEQTPTGRVRSVPKLVFTDAEAGALEFPSSNSRSFNYFEPARMKATVYEDVTVDVQPDPERYLTQNWIYGFAQGPGGYPKEWTEAISLEVYPVAELPLRTLAGGGQIAIVTKGPTPFDGRAAVRMDGDVVADLEALSAALRS
jgi:hypothetical protein